MTEMKVVYEDDDGALIEETVAAVWEICSLCEGEGAYVNPSIDAHGLSAEDFAEDPDFAEDYFRGVYNISCRECGGNGKIKVPEDSDIAEKCESLESAIHAERVAERRVCARESGDIEGYCIAADPRF